MLGGELTRGNSEGTAQECSGGSGEPGERDGEQVGVFVGLNIYSTTARRFGVCAQNGGSFLSRSFSILHT